MKLPKIPYCGRRECDENNSECRSCMYFFDDYCDYWDLHSPNDCPYCNGTGYSFDGGQCEECYGTGEKQS
ncbi:hypothetical protein [Ruminococcus sp. HUN007]|uniref:hypothetical protein n=1 Tax=Ruminococcus sp. HUN007 TaxID=1514668 RepID=UPI0005D1A707|nr:hypothetical protein [Ruminococcus sp. HUN007]